MHPLICETVTATSMAELLRGRDAVTAADLVELRLDGVADLDVAGALAGRRRPVVVTCRPTWEGGRFDGPEAVRRAILEQAFACGAEYVDIEWRAGFDDLVRAQAGRVVLSAHDFHGVPADLSGQAREMRRTGAGRIKIAVMPARLTDLLPLRAVAAEGPAIVIGMGGTGLPTRLLAAHFGSIWSYAGQGAAPGQVPAVTMAEVFRFPAVTAATAVYGVVGNNVLHSLSPAMHNAAFTADGRDAVYVPFLPADFADFLAFADAFGIAGASVTIPYKLDALAAAQGRVDALTGTVGAANTLRRTAEGWDATNTDVDGFLAPLDVAYPGPLTGARAAVLGAGGSARAVIVGLLTRGATVTVHARRTTQADALAEALRVRSGPWPPPPGSWDLLVNCTPIGSSAAPDASPLPGGPFDGRVVYDLTYRASGAGEAPLLVEARRAGCVTIDGLPMLVAQAERQYAWWTGQAPSRGVMGTAARHRLDAGAARTHG